MDYLVLILSGMIIGLIAAVPIGPVNLICIRRTLQCGTVYGFKSGLGAALGDGLFATVTGFSITAVAQLIEGYSTILQVIGGILLLVIGVRMVLTPPPPRINESFGPYLNGDLKNCTNGKNGNRSSASAMASTLALTITNPATLFFFTAWFASYGGLANNPSFFAAAFAVIGVVLGSATWWLILTTVVGKLHARIDDNVVRIINGVSGALVAVFGLGVLIHVMIVHLFR
jgi:putative LysE/RhtB family amino acid efflux pump